jgi:hypothetical protein
VSQWDNEFWPSESSSSDDDAAASGAANASTAFCSVGPMTVGSSAPSNSINARELEASQHASAYAHDDRGKPLAETQVRFVGATSSALPGDTKASVRGGRQAAGLMLPDMKTREEDAINVETVEAWKKWKTLQMKNELPNVETRGEDSMDVTPDVPGFPVHREQVHEAMDVVSSE